MKKFIRKKFIEKGICYITGSQSNIIFSLTDLQGNQITWLRPALLGFKGSKRLFSLFAIQRTMLVLIKRIKLLKMKIVHLIFNGLFRRWVGRGIIRSFYKNPQILMKVKKWGKYMNQVLKTKIFIASLKHRNSNPHGFMRFKKMRRL